MRSSHNVGVGHPLLRREAEHRLDLRAHVEAATGRPRLPAVRRHRHALEQRPKALFAELLGGDVIHESSRRTRGGAPAHSYRQPGPGLNAEGGSDRPYPAPMRRVRVIVGACALLAACAAPPALAGTLDSLTDAQIAARFAPRLVLHPEER